MRTVCVSDSARVFAGGPVRCAGFPAGDPGETPAWPAHDRLLWHYSCESPQRLQHHAPFAGSRLGQRDTMSHPVFSCFADENVKTVLSIDDIIQSASRRGAPTAEAILAALKALYARRAVEAA